MRPKLLFSSQHHNRGGVAPTELARGNAARLRLPLIAAGLAMVGGFVLTGADAMAQSTRGSAGSAGTLPPQQLVIPGQTFGAAGGTRGSAAGAQPGQPVNYAQPVQGLQPTPDQITSTPQFGVSANGSTPYLAGQASSTGLPLVSEDYEQLGGIDVAPLASVTGPAAAAPSGPPKSYLAIPGRPYSQQQASAGGAPVSTGPSGAAPSGPPKSTLLVVSPSGIDYSKLPSSLDSRPTQRSASNGERNVSSAKSGSGSLPSLTPLKLPSSSSSSDSSKTANASGDDDSSTRKTSSLSLTPPSSTGGTGTTRPSLSLNNSGSSSDDEGGEDNGAAGGTGGALTIPQLPSLSLNNGGAGSGSSASNTGSGVPSLGLTSRSKPSNFQITGYRSGATGVPATSLSQLNALARAMSADPKIKVRLVSYAKPSGQISARTLSATRAVLVRKHLIQSGIDESRIAIRARGDNNGAVASDRIDVEVKG